MNVHLHLKVLMLGSPTDTLAFFFYINAKHLNLTQSTISSTSLFKMSLLNVWVHLSMFFILLIFLIVEKPGVCPSKNLIIGLCAEMCSHDGDCPNDEKCCSNGCGHQCTAISIGMLLHTNALVIFFSITVINSVIWFLCVCITEKPGVCPRRFYGVGLCAELCVNDIDCPNDEKCCRTICGCECASPFKGIRYIDVWVPTDTFEYFYNFKCQAPEFGP